ncbi:MAG: class I SAM-dependent methyltransferase [Deltaproteobacteria bacterium]|nr:class I SAM-dependent methyltransferase [Deltaproteobacteria bacterium]
MNTSMNTTLLRCGAVSLALALLSAQSCSNEKGEYQFSTDWTSPHAEGWARVLEEFKGKPNVHALEIGSWEGRSAIWFLENILTGSRSTMSCIDTFHWGRGVENRFDWNIKVSGKSRQVIKLKGMSQEILRTLEDGYYDFIYVDGCHRAACTLTDVVMSYYLLKPGGLMILDDYLYAEHRPPVERPQMAIDAFLEAFGPHVELVEKSYQVVVRKKDAEIGLGISIDP